MDLAQTPGREAPRSAAPVLMPPGSGAGRNADPAAPLGSSSVHEFAATGSLLEPGQSLHEARAPRAREQFGFCGPAETRGFPAAVLSQGCPWRLPFGERDGKILASSGRLQTTRQGWKLGMWQRTKPSGGPVRATQQEQPSQNGYFG
ncbi:hypothetical protein Anapl_18174 [Anas platyrhynchos]|uniref:Uncharacterized protein n=1 Tax=Anas platyrhynchos TaxID=8839 RepID=R0J7R9_ANAPL|nr:hypothetical protein Anapl_18174 [Anas platyrhynchos]